MEPREMTFNERLEIIQDELEWIKSEGQDISGISDGYHSFEELYKFRLLYNAALFNEWGATGKYDVHKSWRHNDDELCFGGGWFIVVAMLPDGQISNHYPAGDWDLFKVPEVEKAYPFDGHTGKDVIKRLFKLINQLKQ
jgi:hypothetical protein